MIPLIPREQPRISITIPSEGCVRSLRNNEGLLILTMPNRILKRHGHFATYKVITADVPAIHDLERTPEGIIRIEDGEGNYLTSVDHGETWQ